MAVDAIALLDALKIERSMWPATTSRL